MHLISTGQLRDIGFGESTARGRVRAGRLHVTPFPSVYSLAPPPLGRLQTIRAAALSCGHPTLAGYWSATAVLEIAAPPLLPVHVTRPTGNGRGRGNIIVHRSVVPACDTSGRDGILCTSAARTILDLAPLTSPSELEAILIAADSRRILNRRRLFELIDRSRGRRGVRMLRSLLVEEPIRVRSKREIDMLQIARRAGLPEPIVNGRIAGMEVDFHWPELRLVAEVDGWRFHGGRERANSDRDRDQRLMIAGWLVIRFTRDQIAEKPGEWVRRLAAAAARRESQSS